MTICNMKSVDINKFVELGFLLNKGTFTVYGQEIVDNFVSSFR